MDFAEWWEKKAPDINNALRGRTEYIKPYFENAFEFGKTHGKYCASCGKPLGRVCDKCQRLWES